MSYAVASALQEAIFARLSGDAAIAALVGNAIFDSAPPGPATGTYVSLGPEDVRDASSQTSQGAVHDLVVSVVTDEAGFQRAKTVAAAVQDALFSAPLSLVRGRVVEMWFQRAKARRVDKADIRRIDLVYGVRVEP